MIVPICEDDSTATVVDGHPSSITTSAIAALLGSNTNMVGTDPQSPPSFRSSSWRSVNRGQHCLDPSVGVPTVPVSLASSSRTPSHDSNEPSFHRPRLAPIFTGQGTEYPANPLSSSEPHLTGRMAQLLLKSPRPHAQLKQASPLDLYFLGISTLICGVLFSWNEGLTHGFWEYFAVLLATLVAYWCLILCLSEMSSALPFNGKTCTFFIENCSNGEDILNRWDVWICQAGNRFCRWILGGLQRSSTKYSWCRHHRVTFRMDYHSSHTTSSRLRAIILVYFLWYITICLYSRRELVLAI